MEDQHHNIRRILFLTTELQARGTNEYAVYLADELKRRGIQTCILCGTGPMIQVLEEKNIPFETFEHMAGKRLPKRERELFGQKIHDFAPQVVHAQNVQATNIFLKHCGKGKLPLVLTIHASPPKVRMFKSQIANLDGIVATTQDVREELVNNYKVPKSKIRVIANGIDVHSLETDNMRPIFSNDTVVIGSVGPAEEYRGHKLFLKAAAQIVGRGKNFQFVVAGEGDEIPKLSRLANKLGVDGCLTFARDFSSYKDILEAIDIVVQTSLVNVSGFSILDAMAHGRAVIAFNTGTACEIIEDGNTGKLVPRDDVELLAAAIEDIAENPEMARKLGESAREKVIRNFNVRTVADNTLDLYEDILKKIG
jgi:glycosyltransferase involved in cell wall biosynthesis